MTRFVGPTGSRRRRRFLIAPILLIAAISLLFVASAGGVLSGSTFEAQDGNLIVDDGGTHDWNTPVETIDCGTAAQIPHEGLNCSTDLTKSTSDNAFGQGSKEDGPNPTVVQGSIPPNKSDLTRFYINKEESGGHHFLYMAWERSNVLGSANMDFEFNRNQCVSGGTHNTCDGNGVTPVRVNGDLLVTYDFANGGNKPSLHTLRWLDPNSGTGKDPYTGATYLTGKDLQCFSANGYPCWGDRRDITAAGLSEGGINTGGVLDTNPPLSGPVPQTTLPGLTFGEAGLDLENIGVFQAGTCATFGSAYLKSRSSDSFPAELKDFVAPIAVNISNCGTLIIKKVTVPSPDPTDTSFSFTVDGANPPNTILPKNFSLKDGQSNTTQVFAGNSFSAAETVPANWTLTSATCSNGSGTLAGSTISGISVAADEEVTCTFTNTLQLGAIRVTKQSTKDNAPLSGATFEVRDSANALVATLTTGADGTDCVASLAFGDYTVTETAAPSGYKIDNPIGVSVTVDHSATCSTGTPNAPPSAFTDTPLSKITVSFESLAAGNPTSATIECSGPDVNLTPVPLPEGTPRVLGNGTSTLVPGTYDCEVVVDP